MSAQPLWLQHLLALGAALGVLVLSRLLGLALSRRPHAPRIVFPLKSLTLFLAVWLYGNVAAVPWPRAVRLGLESGVLFFGLYLLITLLDHLRYRPTVKEPRERLPRIFRDLVRFALMAVVLLVLLKNLWGLELTPILTASAVGSLVLGLALQETLGNFFSGVALLFERPFEEGDWISVQNQIGRVVQTTWRATRLHTLNDEEVIIPNNVIARENIFNYSRPSIQVARRLRVGTSYEDPPDKVKAVLLTTLGECPRVLRDPPPEVRVVQYADFSITYELKFWIDDFLHVEEIQDEVMARLWYAFKRNGITIPFPIRTVHFRAITPEWQAALGEEQVTRVVARLREVELFRPLADEELEELARRAKMVVFGKGERIISQGEKGDSLFVVARGVGRVTIQDHQGVEREVARLSPGDFFGEMSLMTGEPRSATVTALEDTEVYEITKAAFAGVLSAHAGLDVELSKLMERRMEEVREQSREWAGVAAGGRKTEAYPSILQRMRNFFGL